MGGGTLKKLVSTQMGMPFRKLYNNQDSLRWAIQIGEALAYLHSGNPVVS